MPPGHFDKIPLPSMGIKHLSGLLLLLTVSGCSSFADKSGYQQDIQQQQSQLAHWQAAQPADDNSAPNTADSSSILALLASEQLEQLVQQSLTANPGLQQTLYTLRKTRAERRVTDANGWPEADLSFSGQRSKDSGNSFNAAVSVSWELDLWAQLADNRSAASEDVAEQLATFQSARDTLVAEVMSGWLQLIQLQQAISIQQQLLVTLRNNEQTILSRYRSGIGELDDLDSARTSLASAEATQADNQYQLVAAKRSLRTLLGLADDTELAALGLTIPTDFPAVGMPLIELPEQTLARRPDLLAAWHALKASELRVDIAYKDMLPSISLSASLSDSGGSPSAALFDNPVWTILGQLTAPLFRAGALQAAADAAEYSAAQSAQSYRETLLTAVQEVENALDLERSLQLQQAATEQSLQTAIRNEQRYQQRYRAGLATLLELLNVQQSRYSQQSQLNSLTYQRLNNRITLGLALGLPGVSSNQSNLSTTSTLSDASEAR